MTQGTPSKVDSQVGEDTADTHAGSGVFFRGLWSGGVNFLVVKNHLPQFFWFRGV